MAEEKKEIPVPPVKIDPPPAPGIQLEPDDRLTEGVEPEITGNTDDLND